MPQSCRASWIGCLRSSERSPPLSPRPTRCEKYPRHALAGGFPARHFVDKHHLRNNNTKTEKDCRQFFFATTATAALFARVLSVNDICLLAHGHQHDAYVHVCMCAWVRCMCVSNVQRAAWPRPLKNRMTTERPTQSFDTRRQLVNSEKIKNDDNSNSRSRRRRHGTRYIARPNLMTISKMPVSAVLGEPHYSLPRSGSIRVQMVFISGEGGGAGSRLTQDVGNILAQLPETVEALTGSVNTSGCNTTSKYCRGLLCPSLQRARRYMYSKEEAWWRPFLLVFRSLLPLSVATLSATCCVWRRGQ